MTANCFWALKAAQMIFYFFLERFPSCHKSVMRLDGRGQTREVLAGFILNGNLYFEVKGNWSSGTLEWSEPWVAIETVIGSNGDKHPPRG